MSTVAINPALVTNVAGLSGRDEIAAKRVAIEFEAILLTQLTSAMNSAKEEDDETVFSGTGADFYRQMFGERMAKVMADNGGVGLAETIMKQIREKAARSGEQTSGMDRAISAIQSIRETKTAEPSITPAPAASVDDSVPTTEMSLPVSGTLTSAFGLRSDPMNGNRREHRGIDLAAPRGTPIGAAADGKVVFSGRRGGYGNTVIIEQADGRQSLYGHADQILVSVGDQVKAGQSIATVGSTGRSTGPHVHFEVRENGRPVDPMTSLAKDFASPGR